MTGPFAWLTGSVPARSEQLGQKAHLLARCAAAGERVPPGFVLTAAQAESLVAGDRALREQLQVALGQLREHAPAPLATLAVRSSPGESLPGALLTRLVVPWDAVQVGDAIAEVVASASGPAVRAQRAARGLVEGAPVSTAVIVQVCVGARAPGDFGAVVFSRDPASGEPRLVGEHLTGTGPHEIVSGRTVPEPLALRDARAGAAERCLERRDPSAFAALEVLAQRLERLFEEPLELELLCAAGQIWLLQVRPLVMTARALTRVALEAIEADSPAFRVLLARLAELGLAGLAELALPPPEAVDPARIAFRGLGASPGAGTGVLVLEMADALARAQREPVVLMRRDAAPEDVAAFRAAKAVVTTSGGLTSHAAVITRGLRVPAAVGCSSARIDLARRAVCAASDASQVLLREGDLVSVDGQRGVVYRGELVPEPRVLDATLRQLFVEVRKLRREPLWAWGAPEPTLRLKEEASLDGILCPVAALDRVPAARGRECWAVVQARDAIAAADQLPMGWGLVIEGDLEPVSFEALRARARVRPIGAKWGGGPTAQLAGARLDLLVITGDVGASEALSALAPRRLRLIDLPINSPALGNSPGTGLAVRADVAMAWALRLAARGPNPDAENGR